MTHPDPLQMLSNDQIDALIALGRSAGNKILSIYNQRDNWELTHKLDESPLTAADIAANDLIFAGLTQLSQLPLLSEEGTIPRFIERQQWESYWLIDPLDGTKEFIAGNGQFTVNIALIRAGIPIFGLVHVPTTDTTYLGVTQACNHQWQGAWKLEGDKRQAINTSKLNERLTLNEPLRVILSNRHGVMATQTLLKKIQERWPGGLTYTNAGSSLKMCLIAEGKADFYPRTAPTCEWDTAAAQAVVNAAGGRIIDADTQLNELIDLTYNHNEDLVNPHFFTLSDRKFDWSRILFDAVT